MPRHIFGPTLPCGCRLDGTYFCPDHARKPRPRRADSPKYGIPPQLQADAPDWAAGLALLFFGATLCFLLSLL